MVYTNYITAVLLALFTDHLHNSVTRNRASNDLSLDQSARYVNDSGVTRALKESKGVSGKT